MPSLDDLNVLVLAAFEQAQESLIKIEEAAQVEERPVLHTLTQAYARLLSPLRDYVASANMGRLQPRQLANRVSGVADAIFEHLDDVRTLGLQPDGDALTLLMRTAETAT